MDSIKNNAVHTRSLNATISVCSSIAIVVISLDCTSSKDKEKHTLMMYLSPDYLLGNVENE
jgi:hypothetical protein